MPVVFVLIGVAAGLMAAAAGVSAGLPVPVALALYLCAGNAAVLGLAAAALLAPVATALRR